MGEPDMSYLVLARKYRPQTFDDLLGQEHVTRTLTNAIKLNRIAHGYLFTGTRGVGKTTVARIFAKALNCESADGPTPTPCGKCASCKEIASSTSADVFEIDAASNTGVDDIRELRENVKYLPSRSRYKVYIVDEVHMLSKNAFNALLKTLEEPPPHVVFIFATTEPHKIPDTVLSRTQQYEFKMVGLGPIRDYLAKLMASEEVDAPTDVLMLVARKAAGSVRDALSYMDQVLSYGPDRPLTEIAEVLGVVDRQVLLDISAQVLAGDPVAVLDVLGRLGTSNWDVKDLLGDLLEHFRNLVAAKLAKKPEALIDAGDAELAALQKQVKSESLETLEHLFKLLADAEELVLRSGQPRLVLEMTLIRMAQATKVTPLDELLAQLTEIKANLGSGGGATTSSAPAETHTTAATFEPAPVNGNGEPPDPQTDPTGAFAAGLRKKIPSLAAALADGEVVRNGAGIVVRIPQGFNFNRFERESELVKQVAGQVFGAGTEVALEATAKRESRSEKERLESHRAAEQRRQQIRKETLAHPAVQWTSELFPEADVSVRPLKKQNGG